VKLVVEAVVPNFTYNIAVESLKMVSPFRAPLLAIKVTLEALEVAFDSVAKEVGTI
jgi:hypothetical protein